MDAFERANKNRKEIFYKVLTQVYPKGKENSDL